MGQQPTFASLAWSQKGKTTRRERFLAEMNAVMPWAALRAVVAPHYPRGTAGRPPIGLDRMLRIYFVQQWFDLSDPAAEDALYDSEAIRRFVGIELGDEAVPDESTILRFRHLLEQHQLTEALFSATNAHLEARGLMLRRGTIVDATIIAAPSSTKNEAQARDPEMRQTRQGKTWHFGMKLHVGTDLRGTVHSVTATDAATTDRSQLPDLVHGQEDELYGDQAYWREEDRLYWQWGGGRYRVNRLRPQTKVERAINRARSRKRARGEHAFHVVKRLWGFRKTRYRGIYKNLVRAFTMFGLGNLYLLRRRLLPKGFVPRLA